jgi:hypothetical protein
LFYGLAMTAREPVLPTHFNFLCDSVPLCEPAFTACTGTADSPRFRFPQRNSALRRTYVCSGSRAVSRDGASSLTAGRLWDKPWGRVPPSLTPSAQLPYANTLRSATTDKTAGQSHPPVLLIQNLKFKIQNISFSLCLSVSAQDSLNSIYRNRSFLLMQFFFATFASLREPAFAAFKVTISPLLEFYPAPLCGTRGLPAGHLCVLCDKVLIAFTGNKIASPGVQFPPSLPSLAQLRRTSAITAWEPRFSSCVLRSVSLIRTPLTSHSNYSI